MHLMVILGLKPFRKFKQRLNLIIFVGDMNVFANFVLKTEV